MYRQVFSEGIDGTEKRVVGCQADCHAMSERVRFGGLNDNVGNASCKGQVFACQCALRVIFGLVGRSIL